MTCGGSGCEDISSIANNITSTRNLGIKKSEWDLYGNLMLGHFPDLSTGYHENIAFYRNF